MIASGERDHFCVGLGDVGDSSADLTVVKIQGKNWLPSDPDKPHRRFLDYLNAEGATFTITVLGVRGNNLHGACQVKHAIIASCKEQSGVTVDSKCA